MRLPGGARRGALTKEVVKKIVKELETENLAAELGKFTGKEFFEIINFIMEKEPRNKNAAKKLAIAHEHNAKRHMNNGSKTHCEVR